MYKKLGEETQQRECSDYDPYEYLKMDICNGLVGNTYRWYAKSFPSVDVTVKRIGFENNGDIIVYGEVNEKQISNDLSRFLEAIAQGG